MRILFVTPYVPSRIRARPFNLIKCLSREHAISLVSLLVDDYEHALVKEIEPYCVSVDLVPLSRWQAYTNCLCALPTSTPLRVAYYRSRAFVHRVKEVIQRQGIDLVHGELIKVVPILKAVLAETSIPILYDSVDCSSWFLEQNMHATPDLLKKIFTNSEFRKMRRYERRELVDFDQLIISSPTDRHYLSNLIGEAHKIQVISNSVDTEYFIPQPCSREANTLVFCAKMDYSPNSEGIIYFCKYILPLIWEQLPDVRLKIVGNNAPSTVLALGLDKRITLTGYVQDVRPYLATASIAIAPLLVAAGTQFKILQALAMETPIVTMPRCSHALGTQDSVHLLVAEEPQAYANAVLKLLAMPRFAQQLASAGRQFVIEHYSWSSTAHTLNELYQSLVMKKHTDDLVSNQPSPYREIKGSIV